MPTAKCCPKCKNICAVCGAKCQANQLSVCASCAKKYGPCGVCVVCKQRMPSPTQAHVCGNCHVRAHHGTCMLCGGSY